MTLLRGNKDDKKQEKTSKGRKKQQTNKQVWGHRAFTVSNRMRTRQKLSY